MSEKIRTKGLFIIDIILVNVSLLFAYLLRFDGDFRSIPEQYAGKMFFIAVAATLIKVTIYWSFKMYGSLWRYASIYEMLLVMGAAAASNCILMITANFFSGLIPRSIFAITIFTDICFIGGVRFGYRVLRRIKGGIRRHKDSKRVMIIGAGEAGAIIIRELRLRPELKMMPAAIIDDDRSKAGKKLNGIPIVGHRADIVRVAAEMEIDEIIIAIPSAGNKAINEIYTECSKTACKVKILPGVSQLIDESVSVQKVRDVNIEDLLGRDPVKLDTEEISSYLEEQVVMITGGGGSIGSELCRQIASFGPKQLIILDIYENNAYDIQNELLHKYPGINLVTVIANIREKQRMESIFHTYKPQVVFHAAAHKHVPLMEMNPTEAIKNNVFGTFNVAECADKYGVNKFVLISTDKAVNPTNIMGATKRIAEMIIQAINRHSKTEFVAVRFGNVLGSNGSVIPLFKKQIEQGGPVTVTHPGVTRFFMTIPEAVGLVIQAGAMAQGGEIFVLDMGEPVRIYDLAKNLIKLSGFEPEEDIKIEIVGLRPGEKLYEELLMAEEGLQTTKNDKIFIAPPIFTDLTKLRKDITVLNDIIIEDSQAIIDYLAILVPTYKNIPQAG